MKPAMSDDEISFIKKHLTKDTIMLEWGSGGSTVYFPKYVKKYYSIEHDPDWFNKVTSELNDRNISNVESYLLYVDWYKTARVRSHDLHLFQAYIDVVKHLKQKFDVVFIDGRARLDCARVVIPYLNENAIVFFHDFQRKRYQGVLKWYDCVKRVKKLGVLRRKKK